jgi:exoribonuclease II
LSVKSVQSVAPFAFPIELSGMSFEGRIVEFLDAEQLRVGYVRKQERDRLHLIDPRGRNVSVSGDRVVIVHRPVGENEFPSLAKQIAEKIAAHQSQIDIELLWQSVSGTPRDLESAELAELFFDEATPEAASAVFRALSEDTLFFKRKGFQFQAKTAEQVGAERTRRHREREHKDFREQASKIITQLLRKKDVDFPSEANLIIDRIHNWLRYRTGDEVGSLLEEIAGQAKARDAAYEILLRAGKVDPSVDRFLVMAGIETEFSIDLKEGAERVSPYLHAATRVDFQHLPAFTIDDEDTREVDDAITVANSGSEIIVGIHIADVSAFVRKGDSLDVEAAKRLSTIYLPAITVCMFPERLSTGLMSLNAGEPRPAFTVEVRFDEDGNRLGYRIVISTIKVDKRWSYDQADEALASGAEPLQTLHRIATRLRDARAAQGAITFRRPELKIHVHEGEIDIHTIDPNSASRLIVSEMMILSNGLAADFASVNALPVIYRTQEPRETIAVDPTPAIEALAFEKLRKTFKRSRLSLTPGLHSGLGLTAYTQASSPIRRYADLVTQRQFTAMLQGEPIPYGREELLRILVGAEAAEQEIRAIENRSTDYWLLEYLSRYKMSSHLPAVVLDTKGNIELCDYYLRVKVTAPIKAEPGTTVAVQIESIDPARGEIRLRLV